LPAAENLHKAKSTKHNAQSTKPAVSKRSIYCAIISSAGRDQRGAQSPVGRSNTVVRRYPDDPTEHRHGARNVFATAVLADLHGQLTPVYSDIARLSIDPELMKGALPM
jgi:hypothetical protein